MGFCLMRRACCALLMGCDWRREFCRVLANNCRPILGHAIISFAVIGPAISVIAIWGRNPIIQSIFVAYYIVLLGIADFQPRPLEDASFGDQFVNVFRAAYYSLLVLFLLALFAAIARRREERSAMKPIILVVFIVLSATLALALPQML
jgi:hypothetical protein